MTRSSATLQLPRWVQRLGDLPDTITREAMHDARDFLREEARRNASKGGADGLSVRSGRLLRSIRTYLRGNELSLGSVFYGRVQNQGALIRAKQAPYLVFNIPGVGWRRAKSVRIPARPWASDALAATRAAFPKYLHAALERFTRPT